MPTFQEQFDIGQSEYLADILPRRDVGPVRYDGWKPDNARGASFNPTLFRPPSGQTSDYYRSMRSEPAFTRPFNLPNDLLRSTPSLMPGPSVSFSLAAGGDAGVQGADGPPGPPGTGGGGGSVTIDTDEYDGLSGSGSSNPAPSWLAAGNRFLRMDVVTDVVLDAGGFELIQKKKRLDLHARLNGSVIEIVGVDPTATTDTTIDNLSECP